VEPITIALIVAGVLAVIAIIVVATGLTSKCPKCSKWWSIKEAERREVGREPGMKWVTRSETQKDAKGNTSQIQRQVQVQVLRIRYDGLFRCNKCGHELRREIVEEKETW
jgi:hypothetical protein